MRVKKEENNQSLKMLWNGSSKGWRLAIIVYPNNSTIMKVKKNGWMRRAVFFSQDHLRKEGGGSIIPLHNEKFMV